MPSRWLIPLLSQIEQDRLDLAHIMMIKAIGDKSFLAPVDMTKINRVLDLGTGTGICGYLFADLFGVFC